MSIKSLIAGVLIGSLMLSFVGCKSNGDSDDVSFVINNIIEEATLQHPATNDMFYYEVYDSYVAITEYIGNSKDVIVPDMIEGLPVYVIGEGAFEESEDEDDTNSNSAIETIKISKNVYSIGVEAFLNCTALKEVSFTDVGELPEDITAGNGVVEIGENAFEGCESLKKITLPDSVEILGDAAFYGCTALRKINIPSKVDEIPDGFCEGCIGLRDIYISESVKKIDDSAFEEISPLAKIYGKSNSTAAEFAAKNIILFVIEQ